jgi:hypothetical protein
MSSGWCYHKGLPLMAAVTGTSFRVLPTGPGGHHQPAFQAIALLRHPAGMHQPQQTCHGYVCKLGNARFVL